MKQLFTLAFALIVGLAAMAQQNRLQVPVELTNKQLDNVCLHAVDKSMNTSYEIMESPGLKFDEWTEENVGETRYDLQTNYSSQNRLYLHDDGTIGATWTRGMEEVSFPNRGTGYNYFDGMEWGDFPTERIESQHCGWPSYAAYGDGGEVVVAHTGAVDGLIFNTRDTKGNGDWTEFFMTGPAGHEGLLWPRMVTAGTDHMTFHLFALTKPTGNGGDLYNGMDGALLYSRSLDGGTTWDIQNEQPEEVTSDEYNAIGGDYYAIAEPRGDVAAFVVASKWHDMFILKTENNGEDWEKIMVWEHPYPMFDWNTTVTDTFYCTDGAVAAAIDNNGDVHVAFGITRVGHFETGDTYSAFPFVDGLGYWKEGMDPFETSEPLNTLKPENVEDRGNLVGWTQDVNGNGTWDIIGELESIGNYRTGISSMPQITIDESDNVFVLFSSVTETYETATQNYRHLWMRVSRDNGDTWNDEFFDLTGDIAHIFSECVFPSMSANSNDYLHIIYQMDTEPGGAVQGDLDPYTDNYIPYIQIHKPEVVGMNENEANVDFVDFVTQNFPNPAISNTTFHVHLMNDADVAVEVFNITGQKVMTRNEGVLQDGVHSITLDVTTLPSGTYFYTVTAGGEKVGRKMLVQ
ncbi:MAG: T9SS type A sorting domain-containing protein [Bacteroidales bacterium]